MIMNQLSGKRPNTVAQLKLNELKSGKQVITNELELDIMLSLGDDAIYQVRSAPNPKRVGLLDQYIAWID